MSRRRHVAFDGSPESDRLLRLLFGPEDELEARWTAMTPFDVDDLASGLLCALPLVQHRLEEAGIADPVLQRLSGTARKAWYRSQLQLASLEPVVTTLRSAGLEPLLVGAAVRAAIYYPNPGTRVVPALEALLEPDRGAKAAAALHADGWRRAGAVDGAALRLVGGRDVSLIVHDGLPEGLASGHDRGGWHERLRSGARREVIGGVEVGVLAPVDELILVCAVDARLGDPQGLQPVLDAQAILRHAADLAPDVLARRARAAGAVLAVRGVVERLAAASAATSELGRLVDQLERVRPSVRERIVHRLALRRLGSPVDRSVALARRLRQVEAAVWPRNRSASSRGA